MTDDERREAEAQGERIARDAIDGAFKRPMTDPTTPAEREALRIAAEAAAEAVPAGDDAFKVDLWRKWGDAQRGYDPEPSLILRLLSDLAAAEAQIAKWQPIETAPKDGTEILLVLPGAEGAPHCVTAGFWEKWRDELASEYHSNGTYLGRFPTGDGHGDWWVTHTDVVSEFTDDGATPNPQAPLLWRPLPEPAAAIRAASGGRDGER